MLTFLKKLTYPLYILVVSVICLFALEFAIGYWLDNPEGCPDIMMGRIQKYYLEHDRNIIQFDTSLAKYDPELFYTLKPGKAEYKNREFKTGYNINSLGCRDNEASLRAPGIISIGDSYCMGWGVEQDETYTALLEQRLSTSALNMGVSSYGLPRSSQFLARADTDSLNWLIIQHHYNDEFEILEFMENGSLEISSEDRFNEIGQGLIELKDYFPLKYSLSLLTNVSGSTDILVKDLRPLREKHDVHQGFLNGMTDLCKRYPNTRMIVFTLGELGYSNAFMDEVTDLANSKMDAGSRKRVEFLDFSKELTKEHFFRLDGHMNEKGHELVAQKIQERIELLER